MVVDTTRNGIGAGPGGDVPVDATSSVRRRAGWLASRAALPALVFVVTVPLWELLVRQGAVSELILPAPSDIATALASLASSGFLLEHLASTLYVALLGFALGSGTALVVAIFTASSTGIRKAIYPYMVALQVTPRIAIAPILVAWLGFGASPRVALVVTVCFFPIFLNALTGMLEVDREALELFRSLGASRMQTFTQLLLPWATPVIFAGLKLGMTLAFLGAIVAEFVSADRGLGVLVARYTYQLNMDSAFAALLLLTALGLVVYGVMEWLDRRLVFWTHDDRMTRKSSHIAARRAPRQAQKITVGAGEDGPSPRGSGG